MTKLLPAQPVILAFLSALTWFLPPSPNPRILVKHAAVASCPDSSTIKLTLQVGLDNPSEEPLTIGRVEALKERFYREGGEGKLSLIRTSDTLDDFEARDVVTGAFPAIQDQVLKPRSNMVLSLDAYIYLGPSDLQIAQSGRELIVSFRITNLRHDGSGSTYWTTPIHIGIPGDCRLKRVRDE